MRHEEDILQKQVARYLDLKKVLWCHVANERRTSIQEGVRLKAKGVKSGVPDCMIYTAKGGFNGLALELKITKEMGLKKNGDKKKPVKGVVSDNQAKWLSKLSVEGWFSHVAYSFDEAKTIIDNYLKS